MELITGNYDIGVSAFVPRVLDLWDMLEDQGFRIAGIGGSDDHTAGMNEGPAGSSIGSPTTLVLADNLSEAAIIDAIKHGRTIVNLRGPDDPVVEFTAHGKGGATAQIGDDVSGVAEATFDIHITGASGDFIDLIRDGQKVQHVAVTSDDFKHTLTDGTAGPHRYRVQLIDATNQPVVITSHIYVDATGAAGCGCNGGGDPGGVLAVLYALKLCGSRPWRCRRRRKLVRSSPESRAASDTDPLAFSITRRR